MDESAPSTIFKLLIVLLLVLANAFFVASEFALVGMRRSRLATLVAQGDRRARVALRVVDQLDAYISATQLGITLASLALGWIGEQAIGHLLERLFALVLPGALAATTAHVTAAIAIAFVIITALHIVVGELAPKTLALEYTERVALAIARPMEIFYKVFRPFISLLNYSGTLLLRLLKVKAAPGHAAIAYTEEEIRQLLSLSQQSGLVRADEQRMIFNVFDFSDTVAREIMQPRTEVVAVEASASLAEIVRQFQISGYSRLPVYDKQFDNIKGILHSKDVMPYVLHPENFRIERLLHAPLFVPDSAPLRQIFHQMRRNQLHFAIVVDEHGGVEGIVTMEDLLEEIVGEIRDEHDEERELIRAEADGTVVIDGRATVREVNRKLSLNIPESEDYATIAGFLMARSGRLLAQGDQVEYQGNLFTVEQVERRRVARVRMERLTDDQRASDMVAVR